MIYLVVGKSSRDFSIARLTGVASHFAAASEACLAQADSMRRNSDVGIAFTVGLDQLSIVLHAEGQEL